MKKSHEEKIGTLGRLIPNKIGKRGIICHPKKSLAKMTHGMSTHPIYGVWGAMLRRCNLKTDLSYKNYGARGIRVCKRWKRFENFYIDMGARPMNATIDRINNDGNYSRSNCKWASRKDQSNNRRSNVFLTFNGESKTASQWAESLGMTATSIYRRIKRGWDTNKILSTPPGA